MTEKDNTNASLYLSFTFSSFCKLCAYTCPSFSTESKQHSTKRKNLTPFLPQNQQNIYLPTFLMNNTLHLFPSLKNGSFSGANFWFNQPFLQFIYIPLGYQSLSSSLHNLCKPFHRESWTRLQRPWWPSVLNFCHSERSAKSLSDFNLLCGVCSVAPLAFVYWAWLRQCCPHYTCFVNTVIMDQT